MISGRFVVVDFVGPKDAAGYEIQVDVRAQMDERISGRLFLPPLLRRGQCRITKGSVVWGCLDDVTGEGVAFVGLGDADFSYEFNADVTVKKTLTVDQRAMLGDTLEVAKNVTVMADVISKDSAGITPDVSLRAHTHAMVAQTGTQTGSADGAIPPI